MIDEIPVEVRQYLTAGDALAQASVEGKYPGVQATLRTPEVRQAILKYLNSKEAWDAPPTFAVNALAFLVGDANAKELPLVRNLIAHPQPWVRVRAAQYRMAVYYPAGDRAAMVDLFEKMLVDEDDVVRLQAARWIRDFQAAAEMKPYLKRWTGIAAARGWTSTETFTIVATLLP